MVQVWAPVRDGTRRVLATRGQPFVLASQCHRLFQYRTVSLTRVFPVGGAAAAADEQGLPARAFDTSFPRIQVSLALPILDPDDVSSPLAVLELISTAPRLRFSGEVSNLCNALQGLLTCREPDSESR